MGIDFIYGTAWKEELTEACVVSALKVGYRAVDTANQLKHYNEEGVGSGIAAASAEYGIRREEIFLQSKFTFARGQDHRKPYDETAPIKTQVQQSLESSLKHLRTDYLDSYLLHGPSEADGLGEADWQAWRAMEDLCRQSKVKTIGISNVTVGQLVELYEGAEIKPAYVQNRCFALIRWDEQVRAFCMKQGIGYQGFSLLTANWKYLGGTILRPENRNVPHLVFSEESGAGPIWPEVRKIVERTGKRLEQIIFRFARQVGMIPLVGTRSEEHMRLDREIDDFTLTAAELELLKNLAFIEP